MKTSPSETKDNFLPPAEQILYEQESSPLEVDEKTFDYVKAEMDRMSESMLKTNEFSDEKATQQMLMLLLIKQLKQLSVQMGELQIENKVLKEYMTAQTLLSEELINMFGEFMSYAEHGHSEHQRLHGEESLNQLDEEEISSEEYEESEKSLMGYSDLYGSKTKNKKLVN